MVRTFKKISHSIYEHKYHIVFCPKYRYRIFKGDIAVFARSHIYKLLGQKDKVEVVELNIQPDHVHIILDVPPKYSISNLMGFLKGRLASNMFRHYDRLGKKLWGRHLWSRGYCSSTIGLDEERIRRYVKWQEKQDKEAEQLGLDI